MIFSTYWFLTFLLFFLPGYAITRDLPQCRLAWLVIGSVAFHTHFAGPAGVLPVLALGLLVFLLGRSNHPTAHLVGITISVATLLYYKYTLFLISFFICPIFPQLGNFLVAEAGRALPSSPPLAISFFVFEFVHYLVDRRRGHPAIRSPTEFTLFTIFFPTLVAGPIKRYETFLPALRQGVWLANSSDAVVGFLQLALGFAKKLVSDNLTQWIEGHETSYITDTLGSRWSFLTAVGFRILLDFSGYSDMAIGLARIMGIRIQPNFNWPYLALNLRDFWQRWHISLSTWIRDYIYIPLGGSRLGLSRQILNGMLAFALCGLWHGPAWNFVVWGLFHGAGLATTHAYRHLPWKIGSGLGKFFDKHPWLGWLVTLLYVWIGWLLFFYPLPKAARMILLLFYWG